MRRRQALGGAPGEAAGQGRGAEPVRRAARHGPAPGEAAWRRGRGTAGYGADRATT